MSWRALFEIVPFNAPPLYLSRVLQKASPMAERAPQGRTESPKLETYTYSAGSFDRLKTNEGRLPSDVWMRCDIEGFDTLFCYRGAV